MITHDEVIDFLFENDYWQITGDSLLPKEIEELIGNEKYVRKFIYDALNSESERLTTAAVTLYWLCNGKIRLEDELNKLLISPCHKSHQPLVKHLQDLHRYPSSVKYIRIALASGFDYLQYTCSEDAAIAKWFSHALSDINTKQSIDLIREFAQSENDQIREEMQYRLKQRVHYKI